MPLVSSTELGLPETGVPVAALKLDHVSALTTPAFPASGVPLAQRSPLWYAGLPGYLITLDVSSIPGYDLTKYSRVFLPPLEADGGICNTPCPLVVSIAFADTGALGRLGSWVPHISKEKAAYVVLPDLLAVLVA